MMTALAFARKEILGKHEYVSITGWQYTIQISAFSFPLSSSPPSSPFPPPLDSISQHHRQPMIACTIALAFTPWHSPNSPITPRAPSGYKTSTWRVLLPSVSLHAIAAVRGLKPFYVWNSNRPWDEVGIQSVICYLMATPHRLLYACGCVCVCRYVYICLIYVCVCVCVCVYIYYTYACVCIYLFMPSCVCVYVCVSVCVCVCVCVPIQLKAVQGMFATGVTQLSLFSSLPPLPTLLLFYSHLFLFQHLISPLLYFAQLPSPLLYSSFLFSFLFTSLLLFSSLLSCSLTLGVQVTRRHPLTCLAKQLSISCGSACSHVRFPLCSGSTYSCQGSIC